ncbi:hypothetical protein [Nonomuraea sp. NPDC049158]|uniref:hypothetical protein n=1 Tax=Nonomuraea sp. NPDC049158 TaxID=3155649 RepID=UPI0033D87453
MYERLSDRAASIVFIVLALTISLGTADIADGLVLALSPLLVVIAMMLVITREGYSRDGWRRLGMGRLGLRTWPLTIATTGGVCLLATAGAVALGFGRFSGPHGEWPQSVVAVSITGPILAREWARMSWISRAATTRFRCATNRSRCTRRVTTGRCGRRGKSAVSRVPRPSVTVQPKRSPRMERTIISHCSANDAEAST